jgi:hypothetical protein
MLASNTRPRYIPFQQNTRFLAMGLTRLDPAHWIEPDQDLPAYYHNKLQQRAALGDAVYRALPESQPAQRELHAALLAHLLQNHADNYQRRAANLHLPQCQLQWDLSAEPSLWQASLWVQDDICLLQDSTAGYRLTAASLCAASFWRLEDKLGHGIDSIHAPVPDYQQQLAPQLSRFFRRLEVERPVWRSNWSLVASPGLNQRSELDVETGADAVLYLRVERQTLRRLPRSRALVFTIRVYVHPLAPVLEQPGVLTGLANALQALSPQQCSYKGLDKLAPALRQAGLV